MKRTTLHPRGAIAILTLVGVAAFSLVVLSTASILAASELRMSRGEYDAERTLYAAEAGLNEGLRRISTDPLPGSFSLPASVAGDVTVQVSVSSNPANPYQRIIESRAVDATNKQRTLRIAANTSSLSLAFPYAVLTGVGGFVMEERSQVNGNIYSNGNITGANPSNPKSTINGNVWVAKDPGGPNTFIDAEKVTGNVYAHRIQNSRITGEAYTAEFVASTVSIPPAHPEEETPIKPFPIQDGEIAAWKSEAAVDTSLGDYEVNGTESLGPKKIVGNLTFENNSTLTVTGKIYVTGNIIISNNVTVRKAAALGSYSTVIVADGTIEVQNGALISSPTGGYLMMLSTHNSPDANDSAITANNGSNAILYYAKDGTIFVANTGTLNGTMGKFAKIKQNVTISYNIALADFTLPPSSPAPIGVAPGTWEER